MKTVMEELTLKYNMIMKTGNEEITNAMDFHSDVYYTFEVLMQSINKAYIKNIIKNKQIRVFIKKDRRGRVYLKVTGRDRNTKLIIRSNNSKHTDYIGVEGYKITEAEFAKTLDIVEREKLEKSGIAKRFIKEVIPEIDLYQEMGIDKFIEICEEIAKKDNEPELIETFIEPENIGERTRIKTVVSREPKERTHSVIPYELRKEELTKHNHKKIIRFKGKKTNKLFDAYIFIKNGYILAIIEPLSGLGYQYNLNLGLAEDYDINKIKSMIKATLEAEEDIVLNDDAIIRKNHTTIENFKENIETFLNNKKEDKRFRDKIESATKVYQKRK